MHLLPTSLLPLILIAPRFDGWLGIYLTDDPTRAVVAEPIPDSPAARAGIVAGDVLLAVDDLATPNREDFVNAIRGRKAGDRVRIKLSRDGSEQTVVVRLGERPDSGGAGGPPAEGSRGGRAESGEPPAPTGERARGSGAARGGGYLGLSVRETDDGVAVDRVLRDGPAAGSGLAAGDILVAVDDEAVQDLEDLDRTLRTLRPGQRLQLTVRSDGATRTLSLTAGRRPGTRGEGQLEPRTQPEPRERSGERPTETPAEGQSGEGAGRRSDSGGSAEAYRNLEREVAQLREELAELRRQLEELRRERGRE